LPDPFFAKINTQLLPWKKDAQEFGLLQYFIKLPKENIRPIGETSPNLVILVVEDASCEHWKC
jgi:hypothetical protein